jgi:glutamyl-tRNA reductase
MRKHPDENLADWAERVRKFELDRAIRNINKGVPIDLAMEAMSARIQQKMLHPTLIKIRSKSNINYDSESAKKAYEEAFKKNNNKP